LFNFLFEELKFESSWLRDLTRTELFSLEWDETEMKLSIFEFN
jgi:hypothetical protein